MQCPRLVPALWIVLALDGCSDGRDRPEQPSSSGGDGSIATGGTGGANNGSGGDGQGDGGSSDDSGGSTASGGSSGGGGDATASGGSSQNDDEELPELILPIEREGKYVLEFEAFRLEVDPSEGGRITRFEFDGRNVLAGEAVTGSDINFGSTFWPSPQSAWYPNSDDSWPPIVSIDSAPYAASLDEHTIVLQSPPQEASNLAKLSLTKRISADLRARAIVCEFELKNDEAEANSWAGWQVSRVAPGGLSFFMTGESVVYSGLNESEAGGATWFHHPSDLPSPLPTWPESPKLSADAGEGWLGHVADGLVFVKSFPPISPAAFAPGHGEVEVYAVAEYVELEVQGPYTALQPGQSLTWTVRWLLRELPADIAATAGNTALLDFARSIISEP